MAERRVVLSGEVDLASARDLRADLKRAIAADGAHLLIDCRNMTFIDSAGITVLLEAHRELEAQGRHMLIANVAPSPRRALEVLGLTDLLRFDRPGSESAGHGPRA